MRTAHGTSNSHRLIGFPRKRIYAPVTANACEKAAEGDGRAVQQANC